MGNLLFNLVFMGVSLLMNIFPLVIFSVFILVGVRAFAGLQKRRNVDTLNRSAEWSRYRGRLDRCPRCGGARTGGAEVCQFCGQDLRVSPQVVDGLLDKSPAMDVSYPSSEAEAYSKLSAANRAVSNLRSRCDVCGALATPGTASCAYCGATLVERPGDSPIPAPVYGMSASGTPDLPVSPGSCPLAEITASLTPWARTQLWQIGGLAYWVNVPSDAGGVDTREPGAGGRVLGMMFVPSLNNLWLLPKSIAHHEDIVKETAAGRLNWNPMISYRMADDSDGNQVWLRSRYGPQGYLGILDQACREGNLTASQVGTMKLELGADFLTRYAGNSQLWEDWQRLLPLAFGLIFFLIFGAAFLRIFLGL
jgi:hypothetical protein